MGACVGSSAKYDSTQTQPFRPEPARRPEGAPKVGPATPQQHPHGLGNGTGKHTNDFFTDVKREKAAVAATAAATGSDADGKRTATAAQAAAAAGAPASAADGSAKPAAGSGGVAAAQAAAAGALIARRRGVKDKGNGDGKEDKSGGTGSSKAPRNHALMRYSRHELLHLPRDGLEKVWAHYDRDKDEKLSREELRRLARDCVRKISELFAASVREQNPDATDEDVAEAFESERLYLLPGGSDKEALDALSAALVRTIDFRRGKHVTKAMFLVQWHKAAEKVFIRQAAEAAPTSQMTCTIL